jgi:citrate lyase subunit beta/citryl-CoA lyase
MNDNWYPGPAWLTCPADRAGDYQKAPRLADVVVLDLGESVTSAGRPVARDVVRQLFAFGSLDLDRTVFRISQAGSSDHDLDYALLQEIGARTAILSGADHPHDLTALGDIQMIASIESARGVEWAGALAEAHNVVGLMLNSDELVRDMGGTSKRCLPGDYPEIVMYARARVLIAANACHRLAFDATASADVEHLRESCEDAVISGFDATVTCLPDHLGAIGTATCRLMRRPVARDVCCRLDRSRMASDCSTADSSTRPSSSWLSGSWCVHAWLSADDVPTAYAGGSFCGQA